MVDGECSGSLNQRREARSEGAMPAPRVPKLMEEVQSYKDESETKKSTSRERRRRRINRFDLSFVVLWTRSSSGKCFDTLEAWSLEADGRLPVSEEVLSTNAPPVQ